MIIEWDVTKARKNLLKHRITFDEASTVFGDPLALTVPDPAHSDQEERFLTLGVTINFKMVVVAHVDRGDRVRIINARDATLGERRGYEEGIK